jgi:hypothetical protein
MTKPILHENLPIIEVADAYILDMLIEDKVAASLLLTRLSDQVAVVACRALPRSHQANGHPSIDLELTDGFCSPHQLGGAISGQRGGVKLGQLRCWLWKQKPPSRRGLFTFRRFLGWVVRRRPLQFRDRWSRLAKHRRWRAQASSVAGSWIA